MRKKIKTTEDYKTREKKTRKEEIKNNEKEMR